MQEYDHSDYPLFEETTLHQPQFCFDEWDWSNFTKEEEIKKESFFLYGKSKDDQILNTALQPNYFNWDNYKKCWSNVSVDILSNRLELRPILPWQLLQDATFENFLKENEKEIISVVRIGFEVIFGVVKDINDLDKKLIIWLSHHIFDTAGIIEIHDFSKDHTRRIQTFLIRLAPEPSTQDIRIYWKKGTLSAFN
jgi:hypothetical protein